MNSVCGRSNDDLAGLAAEYSATQDSGGNVELDHAAAVVDREDQRGVRGRRGSSRSRGLGDGLVEERSELGIDIDPGQEAFAPGNEVGRRS